MDHCFDSLIFDQIVNQGLDAVQTYLEQCPSAINARDDDGNRTMLYVAVMANSLDIAKFLIDRGADINVRSKNELCSLQLAIMKENQDMVNLLISKGADPNTVTRDRRTDSWKSPLLTASTTSLSMTRLLISSGAVLTPFLGEILMALMANKPDIANYFLDIVIERKAEEIIFYDFVPKSHTVRKSHLQALCSHVIACDPRLAVENNVIACDPRLAVEIMDKLIRLGDNINYANHFGSLFHILITRTDEDEVGRALFDHLLSIEDANCDMMVYTSGQAMTPITNALQIGEFFYANKLLIDGFVDVSKINLDCFRFTSKSVETLKLMYCLGFRFPNDFITAIRSSSAHDTAFAEFCSWLERESSNVMRLKDLIRIKLREKYGKKLPKVVSYLPDFYLPDLIRKYLMFS